MDGTQVVGTLATLCTIALYCTGIPTFYRVLQKKSTGDTPCFPFFIMFSSCSLWFKYGVMKGDPTLMTVNSAGFVLNLAFIVIYYSNTAHKSSLHKQLLIVCILLFPMLSYLKYWTADYAAALATMGLYCATNSVLAYAAPLASLSEVVRTRSTQCMVFPLSLGNFVCALLWVIYGSLIQDMFVKVPNLLGVLLGAGQLSLFLIYSKSTSSAPSTL